MKHGRPLAHAVRWGLGVAIVGGVMALGALDTLVLTLLVAALAGLLALSWGLGEGIAPRPAATVLVAVATLLVGWTALQCVPLPASWLGALSPHAADVWAHALDPLHEAGSGSATLTLDPIATRVELLRGVAYALALLVALRVGHRREGVVFLERALVFAGVAVACAALLHVGLGAHKVYGIYAPKTDVTIVAPLLNVNQLGGYFVIALCISYASMIGPEPIAARPLLALIVVGLVAAVLWVPSRGAMASMGIGIGMATVLTLGARREGSERGLRVVLPALASIAGVVMMMFATSSAMRGELGDTNVSKLAIQWRALRALGAAYPLFGVGRGAFESTFPEFRGDRGYTVFTHPENVVVQWVTEWGLPVAVLGLAAIAWALRPRVLLSRGQPPIGAWSAIVALSLHNLVDFSSEVPGVVLSLVACAALVVAGSADGTSPTTAWGKRPKAVVAVGLAVAVLAIGMALPTRGKDLLSDRLALKGPATDAGVPHEAFFGALRSAMLRHPAEPYFPYLGAVRVWTTRPDESVIPWVDRTLERSPVHPPAHLVLARWLRARSRSQALLEYRLAAEQEGGEVGKEAQGLVRTFDDALELAPPGKRGVDVLEALSQALGARLPATSARLDAELLARDPEAPMPRVRALRYAVADLEGDASSPWCEADRGACVRAAVAAAKLAEERQPDRCEPYALEARVLVLDGRVDAALERLTAAADQVADRSECLRRLATTAIDGGRATHATEAIEKLANASCSTDQDCVQNLVWAAGLEERRGNRGKALVFYKRAAETTPERDDVTAEVARVATAAGMHSVAADAWSKLAARHPDNPTYVAAARQESEAARGLR